MRFYLEEDHDKYIRHDPRSELARLPGREHGPVEGPSTPIKNYDGRFMPDGSAGSGGYVPGPVRQAQSLPAVPIEVADANLLLGKYVNALLNPMGLLNSAKESVEKINNRNQATEDAIKKLL